MRLLVSAVILLCFAMPAAAQVGASAGIPQSIDNQRYTVSGTVVNSVTGEPIRRALVSLFYNQQLTAMTDSDGRFAFEGLPRMSATLTAQKPEFFSEQELSAGRSRPRQITVGSNTATTIKLVPEAIISGRLIDADGLPIPRLLVRAITQKVMQGRKEWQQGMLGRTDADGYYRIINLMPGSYFVVAGPGRTQAFVAGAEDTADLGYASVTYPGSSPLRVAAGQQVEVNFTIRPEPFYSVTGSVSGTSPGNHYTVQLISRTPGMRMPMGGANPDPQSGTFTLPRVARGDYILQARGFWVDRQNPNPLTNQTLGAVPISVRGNVMGVSVPLEPMLSIPINLRSERTREAQGMVRGRNFPNVQIRLSPVDQESPPAFSGPEDPKDPGSPLMLRNAVPGKYRVEVIPTFGDTYVASARYGMTDLLNGELTLTSGANQGAIDVVVRDDAARLTVKVQSEEPLPGISVLVVPDRGEPKLQETVAGPKEVGMQMQGLRPGSYTVLAFEDLGNLEYMNRDALEPYLSRGAKVTLTPNQEATVTPELIKRAGE
jgi:hypothetical protein